MSDELAVDHGDFRRAQDRVVTVHDDLVVEQRRLSETMRSLLGSGWTGEAARQYADGWAEWESGCVQVLDGLSAMGRAMAAVHADLVQGDDEQAGTLQRITQRLGEAP